MLAHGRWFSVGTPASSATKTGRHDIAAILLKVALNTKNLIKIKSNVKKQTSAYKRTRISFRKDHFLRLRTWSLLKHVANIKYWYYLQHSVGFSKHVFNNSHLINIYRSRIDKKSNIVFMWIVSKIYQLYIGCLVDEIAVEYPQETTGLLKITPNLIKLGCME